MIKGIRIEDACLVSDFRATLNMSSADSPRLNENLSLYLEMVGSALIESTSSNFKQMEI